MRMLAPMTASKARVNLLTRSRIKNRNCSAYSPRFMSRLRACWVTHAGDRKQTAIEGEQADPTWTAGYEHYDSPDEPVDDRVAWALADARERIADSWVRVDSFLGLRDRSASACEDPAHSP